MTQFMLLAFLSNPTSYIPGVKAFSGWFGYSEQTGT